MSINAVSIFDLSSSEKLQLVEDRFIEYKFLSAGSGFFFYRAKAHPTGWGGFGPIGFGERPGRHQSSSSNICKKGSDRGRRVSTMLNSPCVVSLEVSSSGIILSTQL